MGGGVVVALGGVAGGACAWGSLLPVEHLAGSQAVIPASPEQVWATIEDVDAYPTWREDVRAIAWPEPPGEADPARRVWVERSSSGDIPFTVVATDPPRRRVTEIAADDLGFGGRWVFDLEWVEPGTRVRIVEEGVGAVHPRWQAGLHLQLARAAPRCDRKPRRAARR